MLGLRGRPVLRASSSVIGSWGSQQQWHDTRARGKAERRRGLGWVLCSNFGERAGKEERSGAHSCPRAAHDKTPAEETTAERLKRIFKVYGTTAVVFHSCVYTASLSSVFLLVKSGVDTKALLDSVGVSGDSIPDTAGEIGIAWGLTALTGPVRGLVTIAGTPPLARWLQSKVQ